MRREFTGRDMAMVMVAGFGVVVAVNFYMASLAIGGFGGVVVENSYVCLLYTSPSPRDRQKSRMPSSA